jgi:hypothetical protein
MKWNDARREFEKRYLTRLLRKTGANFPQASALSGINRTDLYNRVRKLNVPLPRPLGAQRHRPDWEANTPHGDWLKAEVRAMVERTGRRGARIPRTPKQACGATRSGSSRGSDTGNGNAAVSRTRQPPAAQT